MTFTSEQYTAICDAIANGILTVRYSDKTVTYRSLSEMIRIKSMMEKDMGVSVSDPFSRTRFTEYNKEL